MILTNFGGMDMDCISKKVKDAVLITNTAKDKDFGLYKKVLEIICSNGARVRTPKIYEGEVDDPRIEFFDYEELFGGADAAIVLGGDGTILKAAAAGAIEDGCPLLGVNLGRIGYMAEIGKDETELIGRIFEGKYRISERMTLRICVEQGGIRRTVYKNALNDAVLHSDGIGKVLGINVFSRGTLVAEHRGDGLIISTPTGSTAYSLSAGGPVLDPSLECLCITPVCSLSPASRSMVFSADSEIEIEAVHDNRGGIFLSCDGNKGITLSSDARIIISRSEQKAKLISVGNEEFFNVLRKKITSAM